METRYFRTFENEKVQCLLCPHNCMLNEGQVGNCLIRENYQGTLISKTLNTYSAINFDPIEKKPLYHFHPGKFILSVGSLGCNMHCNWCQNYKISQNAPSDRVGLQELTAEELYSYAISNSKNIGIAYTYNEPGIAFETNIKIAKLFYEKGLKNIMVTNGYINIQPLQEYLKYMHAVNLDIKCFDPENHKKYTGADLSIILNNAKHIFQKQIHLELTYLVVPTINDETEDFTRFIDWVSTNLSQNVPLHISRYYPHYKSNIDETSLDKMLEFYSIAEKKLNYVYVGNAAELEKSTTFCPNCNAELIRRNISNLDILGLTNKGLCTNCGKKIEIIL